MLRFTEILLTASPQTRWGRGGGCAYNTASLAAPRAGEGGGAPSAVRLMIPWGSGLGLPLVSLSVRLMIHWGSLLFETRCARITVRSSEDTLWARALHHASRWRSVR